jgi:hypothetical protein
LSLSSYSGSTAVLVGSWYGVFSCSKGVAMTTAERQDLSVVGFLLKLVMAGRYKAPRGL